MTESTLATIMKRLAFLGTDKLIEESLEAGHWARRPSVNQCENKIGTESSIAHPLIGCLLQNVNPELVVFEESASQTARMSGGKHSAIVCAKVFKAFGT